MQWLNGKWSDRRRKCSLWTNSRLSRALARKTCFTLQPRWTFASCSNARHSQTMRMWRSPTNSSLRYSHTSSFPPLVTMTPSETNHSTQRQHTGRLHWSNRSSCCILRWRNLYKPIMDTLSQLLTSFQRFLWSINRHLLQVYWNLSLSLLPPTLSQRQYLTHLLKERLTVLLSSSGGLPKDNSPINSANQGNDLKPIEIARLVQHLLLS